MFWWLAACAAESVPPWSMSYVQTVVPWVQDSTGHWLLFDTGTPRTELRPDVAGVPPGERRVGDWSVGELVPAGPLLVSDVLPPRLLAAEAGGEIFGLGGVLGADLLSTQPWWMDPRGQQVYFGTLPLEAEPVADVPFDRVGGGSSCLSDGLCYDYDPSRILVDVTIEGQPFTLLLDTASTYVVLEPTAYERLGIASHPYDFGEEVWEIGAGAMSLEGAAVDRTPLLSADAELSEALVRLELEVDRPVDGLLGHSFLDPFLLGVDAPAGRLTLSPYTPGTWDVAPEWVSPGFRASGRADDCFVLGWVIVGSPADAAGLHVGDCVLAVDGMAPADLDPDALTEYLAGLGPGVGVDVVWEGGEATLENRDWGASD